MRNIVQPLPLVKEEDRIKLAGPIFLSCGCGNVTARWATVAQNISTQLPQGKPKASRIIHDWMTQEGLWGKYPVLKQHTFGVVVAETDNGIEIVDIMNGATPKVAEKIGDLLRRSNEYRRNNQTA